MTNTISNQDIPVEVLRSFRNWIRIEAGAAAEMRYYNDLDVDYRMTPRMRQAMDDANDLAEQAMRVLRGYRRRYPGIDEVAR